jgi:hypothetical protein
MNRPARERWAQRRDRAMVLYRRRALHGRRFRVGWSLRGPRCRRRFHGPFGYRGRCGVLMLLFDRMRVCLRFLGVRFMRGVWRLYICGRDVIRRVMAVMAAQLDRHILVDRAGVRLLLGDAEFGE